MSQLVRYEVLPLIRAALREDAVSRDLTSRFVIPATACIRARIVAHQRGVLAGGPIAAWAFQLIDRSVRCHLHRREGACLAQGQTILTVEGCARSIFAAERTALNILQHLSGVATLTRAFVERVRGTRAKIYDTRKTLPGLRALEKYAVRIGGGRNHRADLAEAVLIKTNHLCVFKYGEFGIRNSEFGMVIQKAVELARKRHPDRFCEVEVTNLRAFKAALVARPHAILLDNWIHRDIRTAVRLRNSALRTPNSELPLLEVSGGVTLANVHAIAKTGVNRISVGRLTHSAPALDLSLEVVGR